MLACSSANLQKHPMAFSIDNWASQVRKGTLEFCVLNALKNGERYGYDLVRSLASIPELSTSIGTLYPLLFRLREQRLVTTREEPSNEGPPRKYYSLTDGGRRAVEQMNLYWNSVNLRIQKIQKGNEI
ncbi:MAG: PadR family transcriptional regulator [Planctomycetota bacterium]